MSCPGGPGLVRCHTLELEFETGAGVVDRLALETGLALCLALVF